MKRLIVLIILLFLYQISAKGQSFDNLKTDANNISYDDGFHAVQLFNRKVKFASTLDSSFVYDLENNRIIITNEVKKRTALLYGKYKAEIRFNDTLLELDSLEFMNVPGHPLVQWKNTWGVTPFKKLNDMKVLNVYRNSFYPDSIIAQANGIQCKIDFDFLWDKKRPISYIVDTFQNHGLFIQFGENCKPETVLIYNNHNKAAIVMTSTKDNGIIDWIYEKEDITALDDNVITLFKFNNRGDIKGNFKLKKKYLYHELSISHMFRSIGMLSRSDRNRRF